jgi:hypothetical protein
VSFSTDRWRSQQQARPVKSLLTFHCHLTRGLTDAVVVSW